MTSSAHWNPALAVVAALLCTWDAPGQEAKAGPAPNCEASEHHQFDFWIGTWNVTEGGRAAGRNVIQSDLKQCALFESWTAIDGSRGRSVNFYDRSRRRWHQSWIDDRGGALELDGHFIQGSMTLEGERPDLTTGKLVRHRITWTPQPTGSVRQHWETLEAGQSSWQNVFDGLYERSGLGSQ
jgi:hypothetical protein